MIIKRASSQALKHTYFYSPGYFLFLSEHFCSFNKTGGKTL